MLEGRDRPKQAASRHETIPVPARRPIANAGPSQPQPPASAKAQFFIIRSANTDNFELSKRYSAWGTQPHNEEKFDKALAKGPVYLIMSVNNSGAFQGYARMTSRCGEGQFVPWQGIAARQVRNFSVVWECSTPLPYDKVGNMTNPLNQQNPRITRQRDGQDLPHDVGMKLVQLLQEQAKAAGQPVRTAPVGGMGMGMGGMGPQGMVRGGMGPVQGQMGGGPQGRLGMRGPGIGQMGGMPGAMGGIPGAMVAMGLRGPQGMPMGGGMPRPPGAAGPVGPRPPGFGVLPSRAGGLGGPQQQQQQGPGGGIPPGIPQRFQGRLGFNPSQQPPPPPGPKRPSGSPPRARGRSRSPTSRRWGQQQQQRSRSRSNERVQESQHMSYEEYLAVHAKVQERMASVRNAMLARRAAAAGGGEGGMVNGNTYSGAPAASVVPKPGANVANGGGIMARLGGVGNGGSVAGVAMEMQQQQQHLQQQQQQQRQQQQIQQQQQVQQQQAQQLQAVGQGTSMGGGASAGGNVTSMGSTGMNIMPQEE